jgi:hypothetical protein
MLDGSWSPQIRQIGDLERSDHYYLKAEHTCYFFGEYTARGGYNASSTNQIIANIKKKPSLRHTGQWQYKINDMQRVARTIRGAIKPDSLPNILFVPIPPSKLRTHIDYDDRMAVITRAIASQANVREMLETVSERDPLHESEQRLKPDELIATIGLHEDLCNVTPPLIFLVDDVITTGCSFVACHTILQERFPNTQIVGVFVARRVLDKASEDFLNLDDLV